MSKITYRIKNWSKYNRALINRGSLFIWVSDDAISNWKFSEKTSGQGRPKIYSDIAIETALTLRSLWKLPLRMVQGFWQSIFTLMKVNLPIPDYTTLSRRATKLDIDLSSG